MDLRSRAVTDSSRRARTRRLANTDTRALNGLTVLGLKTGETVRFRRDTTARWQEAVVGGRERDGSVRLTDRRGAARTIAVERIEVRCTGPRGGVAWEPLTDRASRTEQLRLL